MCGAINYANIVYDFSTPHIKYKKTLIKPQEHNKNTTRQLQGTFVLSLFSEWFTKKNKELHVNKCFKKELIIKIYYLANNSLEKKEKLLFHNY